MNLHQLHRQALLDFRSPGKSSYNHHPRSLARREETPIERSECIRRPDFSSPILRCIRVSRILSGLVPRHRDFDWRENGIRITQVLERLKLEDHFVEMIKTWRAMLTLERMPKSRQVVTI